MDNGKGKKCFIITPIGEEGSEVFRKTEGVIENVIRPILQEYGFSDIKSAYEIAESGMITNQIINRIINDDLVVANLTGNNPNVMYELAVRHATAKSIIQICETGTELPFDIKNARTIFYKDDLQGGNDLKNKFKEFVKNIDPTKEYKDNPIHFAFKIQGLTESNKANCNLKLYNELKGYLEKILAKQSEFELKRKPEQTFDCLREAFGLSLDEMKYLKKQHNDNEYLFTNEERTEVDKYINDINESVHKYIEAEKEGIEFEETVSRMDEIAMKIYNFSNYYLGLIKEKMRNEICKS